MLSAADVPVATYIGGNEEPDAGVPVEAAVAGVTVEPLLAEAVALADEPAAVSAATLKSIAVNDNPT